ncbi:aspartyl/asparaginyl beta-hydroxylase domain-containing protein [Sphingomonas jaspsi]|uniref:aspartyl/asparaginyl beta-hydroxylase domain-containing protein n=1 Tax=Sphingomonas jaspsi TaxID=392409 RepID=UPI0004B4B2EC|nr:aspartyl/asparaginyl beta-hydroxylase domain-containing protein [Sphingomonas jaspsi]
MAADQLSAADVEARLSRDGQDVEALVAKGALMLAAGDQRGAAAYFKSALKAAAAAQPLPASLRPAIERAQAELALANDLFRQHQEEALARAGFPEGSRPHRFQQALDILNGRVAVDLDLQRPTSFYYPGLLEKRYYDPSDFAWAAAIEAATPAISAEIQREMSLGAEFSPYLVSEKNRPRTEFHGLHDNPRWSVLQLFEKGQPTAAASRFPATMNAMQDADLCRIGTRSPNILFSRLAAGAHIPPHHGMMNARLICHLPLIVPDNCRFTVGGESRPWTVGKLTIFDDSVLHEARNDSHHDRIVLIFDVWKPELSGEERAAITAMFEAIDDY